MKHDNPRVKDYVNLYFEGDEKVRFEKFLKERGSKKAPYIRQLILRELERDESIRSGATQIDPAACRAGGQG